MRSTKPEQVTKKTMKNRISHATVTAVPALGLLLLITAGVVSGCNKSGESSEALPASANQPGGAVSAPPEVKSQIQAAEAAESARRRARASQAPK